MRTITNHSGFTLIELLLYVVIVGILLSATTAFYTLVLDARIKTQAINEVNQQGSYAMDYLTQTVRNATSITAPAAGGSGTTLTLVVPTASASPTNFALSGTTLQTTEGAGGAIPLTSTTVQISNLSFKNLSRSGTNGIVQISFTLSRTNISGLNRYNYQKTFTSSAEVGW
jgi:prepilin-type N-terminal cleavage/methylation domain-containing protein